MRNSARPFQSSLAFRSAASTGLAMSIAPFQGKVLLRQKPLRHGLVPYFRQKAVPLHAVESCAEVAVFRHMPKFSNKHRDVIVFTMNSRVESKALGYFRRRGAELSLLKVTICSLYCSSGFTCANKLRRVAMYWIRQPTRTSTSFFRLLRSRLH